MKKEILRHEEHEDGSYTHVEKTTQTPEDGFVRHSSEHRPGKTMYFKGRATQITYTSTNPRVVYPILIFGTPLFGLLILGFFALMRLFAGEDADTLQSLRTTEAIAMGIFALCYGKILLDILKKIRGDRSKKKPRG